MDVSRSFAASFSRFIFDSVRSSTASTPSSASSTCLSSSLCRWYRDLNSGLVFNIASSSACGCPSNMSASFGSHEHLGENANAPGRCRRGAFSGPGPWVDVAGCRGIHPGARPEGFSGGTLLGCGRLGHRPSTLLGRAKNEVPGELTLLLPDKVGKARDDPRTGRADSRQGRVKRLKTKRYLVETMISTRRLRACPAAVLSSAIGDDSPKPLDCIFDLGMPLAARASRTASARRCETCALLSWASIFTRGTGPALR